MATFRVGQRVVLVRSLDGGDAVHKGHKGVFRGYEFTPGGSKTISGILDCDCDCLVLWDDNVGGALCCQVSSTLEPILYDGNKTVEWSECLWMPEHMKEAA